MKQICTLASLFVCVLFSNPQIYAQCSSTAGSNGVSSYLQNPITIDGNMNDWNPILNDPDNNVHDATSGTDLDAPIQDAGRDLKQFAFTEDANNLYIYLKRAGSVNNAVDILFYADINNNGVMEYREPVIHINWSGSNSSTNVSIDDYIPSPVSLLLNSVTSNLDGSPLMGTLLYRSTGGASIGRGSGDGKSVEIKIPFSRLTTLNILGGVVGQLSFGQNFKFHVSTINGNISSIPNLNSINDNFGGCLTAPSAPAVLPVHLVNFQSNLNDQKVTLTWTVAENETVDKFTVERSTNGVDYSAAGIVFGNDKPGKQDYIFYEQLMGTVMYRLQMTDKNGKSEYSKVLAFKAQDNNQTALRIINNPVTDKITFSYQTTSNQNLQVKVYDMTGRIYINESTKANKGQNLISFPLSSSIKSGIYMVELNDGTERYTTKFVRH